MQVKLKEFTLRRPPQWGACWAFCRLWALLGMEEFWQPRLADSREGTSWSHVLMLQVDLTDTDPAKLWEFYLQLSEVENAFKELKGDLAILAAMQLLDVHFPTTDGRELIFTRYTQPEPDQLLLLAQLGWGLPDQARPRITANPRSPCSTDLSDPTIEFTGISCAHPSQ